jgi:hypothetical protein
MYYIKIYKIIGVALLFCISNTIHANTKLIPTDNREQITSSLIHSGEIISLHFHSLDINYLNKIIENKESNSADKNNFFTVEFVNDSLLKLTKKRDIDYPKTIALDGQMLLKNKTAIAANDYFKKEALKLLLVAADKILKAEKLYSVTHKKQLPPSGNNHDYMSTGPYWWPDPSKPDGLPYIRKDGLRNPEYYEITDSQEMDKIEADTETLALAYYFTKDEKYASFASKLIKIWFLDPETLQNPNLNFGQAIKGKNIGRGTGIIETRELSKVIDAAILIQGSSNWSVTNHDSLKKWFSDYLTWLIESPIGQDEADEKNNHGTHYSAQVISFALFTEQYEIAKKEIDIAKKRMESQFKADGSQPFELERTKSWNYVNMNLLGFCDIARFAEHLQIDLWQYETPEGKNLKKCIDWLLPYIKKEKAWEYEQIEKIKYNQTIKILQIASKKYNNPLYTELAKELDATSYQSFLNQLTFD